jgi:PIN domain nuclease of toxin-antitoxin system
MSMSDEEPLLLDTHCWIWLQSGQLDKFSQGSLKEIRQAGAVGTLRVSIISVWEIALLESKGRVRIHMDCLEWVRRALETPGLSLVPLTPEIAVESTRLPGNIHADPADRILVATARNLGARLMTRDQALLDYGRKRHARIVSA